MKTRFEKIKETAGVIYLIIAFHVGVYYTMKWFFMGLFLLVNFVVAKLNSYDKNEIGTKHARPLDTESDDEDGYSTDFAKDIHDSMFED